MLASAFFTLFGKRTSPGSGAHNGLNHPSNPVTMAATVSQKLRKEERACGKKLTEELFCGADSRSLAAFPLRVVYLVQPFSADEQQAIAPVQMMISVPKRRFKHAVDRNRVKRQVREAYRKNKYLLYNKLPNGKKITLGFLWLDAKHHTSAVVEDKVQNLLRRIGESL